MPWKVLVSPNAARDMKSLPGDTYDAFKAAFAQLQDDPSKLDLKKLAGRQREWRLRVGAWRAILAFDNASGEIHVLQITPRKDAYRS